MKKMKQNSDSIPKVQTRMSLIVSTVSLRFLDRFVEIFCCIFQNHLSF